MMRTPATQVMHFLATVLVCWLASSNPVAAADVADAVSCECKGFCSTLGLDSELCVVLDGTTWFIHYNDDPPPPDDSCHYVTQARADVLLDAVEVAYARQILDFGFAPHWTLTSDDPMNPEIHVYVRGFTGFKGVAKNCGMVMSALTNFLDDEDEQGIRKTMSHELFHEVQRRYLIDGGWVPDEDFSTGMMGKWLSEGTARCMDDRYSPEFDSGVFSGSFQKEAKNTLGDPAESLFDASYRAALFWGYCCEQFGGAEIEPERGYLFVRNLWENVVNDGMGNTFAAVSAAQQTIAVLGGGSLAEVYHDYAICNYTREFDVTALANADRYFYVDETPAGGNSDYDRKVLRSGNNALPTSYSNNDFLRYSAAYYTATVPAVSCTAVGMLARSKAAGDVNQEPLAYALVGVTADDRVVALSKGKGLEFSRTFLVSGGPDAITEVCAIIIGQEDDTAFDLDMATGPLGLTISRPTASKPAYAGPFNDAGTIQVFVEVSGPAELSPQGVEPYSVKGLRASDFVVTIGGVAADGVIAATYLGTEYWLIVDAPDQPANGDYDLTVGVCPTAGMGSPPVLQTTQVDAVRYGDEVVDHVLTIDVSGSMDQPSGVTKMEAAQIAAKLYVDAVRSDDRIGVVAFRGNQSECDDDAFDPVVPLSGLTTATASKRDDCKDAIDLLSPSGWTSIGDGLIRAKTMIDTAPAPAGTLALRNIVLLSDGKENEARFWDQASCGVAVEDVFDGSDVVVDTMSFGPYADQGLMEDIADQTGGIHQPIDSEELFSQGNPLLGPSGFGPLTLTNEISNAYVHSLARARDLQRLHFVSGDTVNGSVQVPVPITEAPVDEALFFVAWDDAAAGVTVELRLPDATLVGAALAEIRTDTHHAVYQMLGPLTNGSYEVTIHATAATQYIVGVLGRPDERVELSLAFSQIRNGGGLGVVEDATREHFEQGVPVRILAVLAGSTGAVPGATIDITVRRPDGTFACGPLELRDDGGSGDGEPGDGIYGATFTDTSQASSSGEDLDQWPVALPPPAPDRGTYLVTAHATGTVGGVVFSRERAAGFHVYKRVGSSALGTLPDSDFDDIPDTWERHYGTDPFAATDASIDADEDGLTHLDEYLNGTHPFDPDTDGGGEADGSEVAAGRCPLRADDDLLPKLTDIEIITDTGDESQDELHPLELSIRFPVYPAYQELRIYRSTVAGGPYPLHTTLNLVAYGPGHYYDTGLVDGTTYYYRFQAIGAAGAYTPLSEVISGTAKLDPFPPRYFFAINPPGQRTDTVNVLLRIAPPGGDAIGYQVSNTRLTGTEPIQPILSEYVAHTLSAPATIPGLATVYLRYVDAAGNFSQMLSESIVFDPAGDNDLDLIPNALDADDDNDGLTDFEEVHIHHTRQFNDDGDGDTLSDFDEIFLFLTNPHVVDSDSDDVWDADDNCPLDPNTEQLDADVDGIGDACDTDPFPEWIRGDVNADGALDVSDPILALDVLFNGAVAPCELAIDGNDDEATDVSDPTYLLHAVFGVGPLPPAPFPDCGIDPTPGTLTCASFVACP